jgi:choline dehydrogenase-like flavoprotein
LPFKWSKVPRNVKSALTRVFRAPLFIGANLEMKIDPNNRVTLSEHMTDRFGNPLAHLIHNFADEDLELIQRTGRLIRSWFDRLGAVNVFEAEVAWSRHHQGTCRMGDNAATSVVDSSLRVHECPNLYLCGSEVFTTGGAMPPALTIVALALRLADHLTTRTNAGP